MWRQLGLDAATTLGGLGVDGLRVPLAVDVDDARMTAVDWTAEVAAVIQRVYGDATQSVLDVRCARAVLEMLQERCWLPPDDAARLVIAVGGEVRLSDRLRMDPLDGYQLSRYESQVDHAIVIRASCG